MPSAAAPLRLPRYRNLWIASVVSNVGSFFQTVAASWLMNELTGGSATWVGLMIASTMLPLLVLALPAGVVADTHDRAKVLVASQSTMVAAAAAMAALTFLGAVSPLGLFLLGLVMGIGMAFNQPAWQAMVPDLVPRELVASAVALNSAAFNMARAVGPALGGLVVATAGPEVAFAFNAVSFVGVLVVVGGLVGHVNRPEPGGSTLRSGMALSLRYARFTPAFRRILAMAALFALTSASVQATLPIRTTELGGDATAYGLLLGVMGVGALLGALTRPRVVGRLGARSLPVATVAFGISGIILGVAPSRPLAMVAMTVAGACWVWTLTTLNATSQIMAPGWVRGRAMSLYTLAFSGVYPLGSVLAGAIADRIGAGGADIVLSAGAVALGLASPAFHIPAAERITGPAFSDDRVPPPHAETEGGPVLVESTWVVDPADVEEFLAVMRRLRLIRLRTGARRWWMYRDASDPSRITEIFLVGSWAEHLAQHRRIDDASAALIRTARRFDTSGEPTTRHLVALDAGQPEDWAALIEAHAEQHRLDGSIPEEATPTVWP